MQLQKLVQEKESIKWCIIRSMRAWNVNKVVHGEQAPRPHHEFGTVSPSPLSSSINCIDAKRTNQGDVSGSLVEFDRAIELDPRQKAYLWQRGLSLYYLDRFEEGAEQFWLDVAQNPNDTEESIWCFLCETQLYGVNEAQKRYLEVSH
ncbi:hypothetical protein HN51_004133 [Arachis hypogaea]|uniref:uncharacterized protein isoform X1 n=1 Tax=Arachis hypogaea TaxID=3818 RepID=UPI003B218A24